MRANNIHSVISHVDNLFIKAKKRRIDVVEQAIVSALSIWIMCIIILGIIYWCCCGVSTGWCVAVGVDGRIKHCRRRRRVTCICISVV